MLLSCMVSNFQNAISGLAALVHHIQCMIWLQWGLKLFPFIMIHADNQQNENKEEPYAITFTHDECWQQRFQRHLENVEKENSTKGRET